MKIWFRNLSWEKITRINAVACEKGRAQPGVSDSQGPRLQKVWENNAEKPMTFWAMLQLCRKMHEEAPFLNFNGNTFAALAVDASLQIPHPDRFILEDLVCNYVAGTIGQKGEEQLRNLSDKNEPPLKIE